MAQTVKERPMAVGPELEVVHTTPTEEHVHAGTFPGTAIAGGIEEIVAPKNLVKTDLPVVEESLGAYSLPFRIAAHTPAETSVRLQPSDTNSAETLERSLSGKLITEISSTAPDVKKLCDTYGLKREELGRMTGFSLRALAEWSAGKLPSQPAKRRLQEIRRLLDSLAEIVKVNAISPWLHQPNPAFDSLTPLQVIEVGEIDRLWAMVHDLSSGQPE